LTKTRRSGFTLIELILVILIISVVTSIALPRLPDFTGARKKQSLRNLAYGIQSLHEHASFKKKA
jgi:prepilin-type N-terminal cleavage/methylation domain-containing protein